MRSHKIFLYIVLAHTKIFADLQEIIEKLEKFFAITDHLESRKHVKIVTTTTTTNYGSSQTRYS